MIRVYHDRSRQRVEVEVETAGGRLVCAFCPRALQDVVRLETGPPPSMPSASEMEGAIQRSLLGERYDYPRADYKAGAVAVIQRFVGRHFRGISIPREAAEAMLNGKDWEQ